MKPTKPTYKQLWKAFNLYNSNFSGFEEHPDIKPIRDYIFAIANGEVSQ